MTKPRVRTNIVCPTCKGKGGFYEDEVTKSKGVRVTVRRSEIDGFKGYAGFKGVPLDAYYSMFRKAGVPVLKPGESVTGRMVFVPDKKKGAK